MRGEARLRAPARQTAASAFVLAHAALAAFREWAASPAVAAAARDCLALMLRSLQPGLHSAAAFNSADMGDLAKVTLPLTRVLGKHCCTGFSAVPGSLRMSCGAHKPDRLWTHAETYSDEGVSQDAFGTCRLGRARGGGLPAATAMRGGPGRGARAGRRAQPAAGVPEWHQVQGAPPALDTVALAAEVHERTSRAGPSQKHCSRSTNLLMHARWFSSRPAWPQ